MTEVSPPLNIVSELSDAAPNTPHTSLDSKSTLIQHLDDLIERYLHTLDAYQTVRTELSKHLSSGYLSLAQANFHNSSSAVRYGADCYDERMQALRRVHVSEVVGAVSTSEKSRFSVALQKNEETVTASKIRPSDEKSRSNITSPEETSEEPKAEKEAEQKPGKGKEPSSNTAVKPVDPLRWFGILVPPALRTAQSTFITAVEGPVARVATLAMELRNQEIEIGRLRKQIKKM